MESRIAGRSTTLPRTCRTNRRQVHFECTNAPCFTDYLLCMRTSWTGNEQVYRDTSEFRFTAECYVPTRLNPRFPFYLRSSICFPFHLPLYLPRASALSLYYLRLFFFLPYSYSYFLRLFIRSLRNFAELLRIADEQRLYVSLT